MLGHFPQGRCNGFTLIETLVVLSILGLALGLILSYGPPPNGSMVLRHAAAELANGLREARSLAIADDRMVPVTLDLASRRWHIDNQSDRSFPDGVEIHLLTVVGKGNAENQGNIRFLPDGSATGGRIELLGANRRILIGVDWLSGRVSQTESP